MTALVHVEIPPMQYIQKVVDLPVVTQRQIQRVVRRETHSPSDQALVELVTVKACVKPPMRRRVQDGADCWRPQGPAHRHWPI